MNKLLKMGFDCMSYAYDYLKGINIDKICGKI